jgi:uncharacterized protein (DUF2345 family)
VFPVEVATDVDKPILKVPAIYSSQFKLVDPKTKNPTANKSYRITKNGTVVVEGKSNEQGYTAVVTSDSREEFSLEIIEMV